MARQPSRRQEGQGRRRHRSSCRNGELLPFPYQSQLDGKLRELRVQHAKEKDRVTYYPAKRRRMVLLTVFRKQQRKETAEIARAKRAMLAHMEADR